MTRFLMMLVVLACGAEAFAGARERIAVAAAVTWAAQHNRPALPNDFQADQSHPQPAPGHLPRLRLVAGSAEPIPRCQVLFFAAPWCDPCVKGKDNLVPWLKKQNWDVGELETDHVRLINGDQHPELMRQWKITSYPTILIVSQGVVVHRWEGYPGRAAIANAYVNACSKLPPRKAVAAAGGKLNIKPFVREFLQNWERMFGPDVPVHVDWYRTGGQTLALLKSQPDQWTPQNLYGDLGEFRIAAPGARGTPLGIQESILGYRRGNGKFLLTGSIEISEETFDLGQHSSPQAMQAAPAQFGPGVALTILSGLQILWEVLHPEADLTLPGHIAVTGTLKGQELRVEFTESPHLKVHIWWNIDVALKAAEVTEDFMDCHFAGSRWLQSRRIDWE